MTSWVCQWNPFWIPVDDDSFKKAFLEEWVFQVTETSDLSLSGGQGDVVEAPKVSMFVSSHHGVRIQLTLGTYWHLSLHCSRNLELPFSCDVVLSGCEDLAGCDSPCGESHQEILVEIHKVVADFRHAFERIQTSSSQASVLFSITNAEEAQHLQLEP